MYTMNNSCSLHAHRMMNPSVLASSSISGVVSRLTCLIIVLFAIIDGVTSESSVEQQQQPPNNEIQIIMGPRGVEKSVITRDASARISIGSLFDMETFNFRTGSVEEASSLATFSMSHVLHKRDSTMPTRDKIIRKNAAPSDVIWHGMIEGMNRTGFCTLLSSSDGKLIAGTMTTETASYEIIKQHKSSYQIRWTYWDEFPPDDDGNEVDDEVEGSTVVQRIETKGILSRLREGSRFQIQQQFPRNGEWVIAKTASETKHNHFPLGSDFRGKIAEENGPKHHWNGQRDLAKQNTSVVDILVLVTDRARCEYAGFTKPGCPLTKANSILLNRIPLLEAETNAALLNSKTNARVRIVGTVLLSKSSGMNDHSTTSDALSEMSTNAVVLKLRTDYGADLVSMITGQGGGVCGRSFINGINSIVSHSCFGMYSFTHEIGHSFGCRHDRSNCEASHEYAHAYVATNNQFRTVMAYACEGTACPRLLYYSAPGVQYKGKAIGSTDMDNSRIIREQAKAISLRNSPPPTTCPAVAKKPCNGRSSRMYYEGIFSLFQCESKCVHENDVGIHKFFGWRCGLCP